MLGPEVSYEFDITFNSGVTKHRKYNKVACFSNLMKYFSQMRTIEISNITYSLSMYRINPALDIADVKRYLSLLKKIGFRFEYRKTKKLNYKINLGERGIAAYCLLSLCRYLDEEWDIVNSFLQKLEGHSIKKLSRDHIMYTLLSSHGKYANPGHVICRSLPKNITKVDCTKLLKYIRSTPANLSLQSTILYFFSITHREEVHK